MQPRKIPLQFLLTVPFVLQIVLAVGITGWLSFRNGQRAVNELAQQVEEGAAARVRGHLDSYLANSHRVNRINRDLLEMEVLSTTDRAALGSHFWRQLQAHTDMGVIYFGDRAGNFIAAQRDADGSFFFVRRDLPSAEAATFAADATGQFLAQTGSIANFIDIRDRPWYRAAIAKGDYTWGDIFALQVAPRIDIPASVPVRDRQGNVIGVLGNNLPLDSVGHFLRDLNTGRAGETFIIERDGNLVASSTPTQPFLTHTDGTTQRLTSAASGDPLLQAAIRSARANFGDLEALVVSQRSRFAIDGERYFVRVLPYCDRWQLDWLIVTILPESEFMGQIHANTRATVLWCLAALGLAICSGIVTARWLSRDVLALNRATKDVARGNWQQSLSPQHLRVREVAELADSFEQMTQQLQQSFEQFQTLNHALSASEDRLTQFLEALPVGVTVHAPDGNVIYINPAGRRFLSVTELANVEREDLAAAYHLYRTGTQTLYPHEELPALRALAGETVQIEDMEVRHPERTLTLEVRATPIFDASGEIVYAIVAFQDITARRRAQAQLRHDALHDALTGLPNRILLSERIALAIERARRSSERQFGLLFIDLDRFKAINDRLGHATGDRLLIAVARQLEAIIRATDLVARLGGDEFTILVEDIDGLGDLVRLSERIFARLRAPIPIAEREVAVSASIGIALGHPDYSEADALLRDADIAMYRAKDRGRACYAVFDTDMHARLLQRLNLEDELRQAQIRQEWVAYYQPLVALATGEIVGFEALVRWQHPQRGLLAPGEFIAVAEDMGAIGVSIDRWMLATACRQLASWREELQRPDLKICVNLSARDLQDAALLETVDRALAATQLPGACLTLEITESMLVENIQQTAALLARLRERGVQVSIDDFGTGYSSLSYLHDLPADALKIDRSFIARAGESRKNADIAETVVALSDRLGLVAVAEGIEDATQLAWLREIGCEFGQGYLFSPPLPTAAAQELLQQGTVF